MNEDTLPYQKTPQRKVQLLLVAHDLSGQAHFHGTPTNRGQVVVSQLDQPTDHEEFVLFV